MINSRRRLRRALISALAGGGLTAAGIGGPLSTGAIGAEPTTETTSTSETPPVTTAPTSTQETTPTPAPPTLTQTTSTQTTTQPPVPPASTVTTPTPPASTTPTTTQTTSTPEVKPPTIKLERTQKATEGESAPTQDTTSTSVQSQPPSEGQANPGGENSGNVAPAPGSITAQDGALSALIAESAVSNQALQYFQVPLFLLPIYQSAAIQYGVPWEILAAINEIETDYGTDLAVSSAGAVGWMQFMPETWLQYGVDALNAGYADPYNPVDAIFAAARYLRAAGAAADLRDAIFSYNHSDAYVNSVMLRARLLASYPQSVIATLTGLTEGSVPVPSGGIPSATEPEQGLATTSSATAKATQVAASPSQSALQARGAEQAIELSASERAAVVAVENGRVVKLGNSPKLGKYLILRDVYGDTFTYSGFGSIASDYRLPKSDGASAPSSAAIGAETADSPKPHAPASAGSHPTQDTAEQQSQQSSSSVPASAGKVRLFAHPQSPYARAAAARDRAEARAGELLPLEQGSVLAQGTVLGYLPSGQASAHLRFSIRPAGDQGTIDPLPILENWRELGVALHPQGSKGTRGLIGATANDVFLMTKAELERAVLSEPGIDIYQCGRQDIASGIVESHILAALLFLSRSGLKPTVSALRCGQNKFTPAGLITKHYAGAAVDISAVNGVQIAGHQGASTITDLTIRTLLTLQGSFAPSKIVSLMKYPGAPSTVASGDHGGFIELEFNPVAVRTAVNPKSSGNLAHLAAKKFNSSGAAHLNAGQWQRLIARIGQIPSPKVPTKPSKFAIRDHQAPVSNHDLGSGGLPKH